MINPDFELSRLRDFLRVSGLEMNDIDHITDLARQDIEDTINGIVEDAFFKIERDPVLDVTDKLYHQDATLFKPYLIVAVICHFVRPH